MSRFLKHHRPAPHNQAVSGPFSMRNLAFAFLVALALLGGCAGVSRFEKGSVVAFGEKLNGNLEPVYYLIRVNRPLQDTPRFVLKLSAKAPALRIDQLSPEVVSQYLPPYVPPAHLPQAWRDEMGKYQIYEGGGFFVSFKGARLDYLGICSDCEGKRESPLIGREDTRRLYPLPLTLDQMTELFGKPDALRTVHEVTYER